MKIAYILYGKLKRDHSEDWGGRWEDIKMDVVEIRLNAVYWIQYLTFNL